MSRRVMQIFAILCMMALSIGSVQAACWQWSTTAGNNATADPSINWSEGMAPSGVNDSARAMMARSAECRDDLSGKLTTAGTSTAYTLTSNQGTIAATPGDGQQIVARVNATNGSSPTLAVDGGTAFPIQSSPGVAVPSGTLVSGVPYRFTFSSGSSAWLLQDFYASQIAAGSIVTSMLANSAVTYGKMQNEGAASLLGNPTGSPAAPSEITLAGSLSFSGTTLRGGAPRGYIDGCIFSQSSATALGVSTCAARSSDNTADVSFSSLTKTTASWAVGSGNGGLDTGAIAPNSWYYVYGIYRPDTGVSDALFTASFGSPTLPANYTKSRYMGAFKTDGSSHVPVIIQHGSYFYFPVMLPIVASNPGDTLGHTINVATPPGVIVKAVLATGSTSNIPVLVSDLLMSDTAASTGNYSALCGSLGCGGWQEVWTDVFGQVRYRVGSTGTVFINSVGWFDPRGSNQ